MTFKFAIISIVGTFSVCASLQASTNTVYLSSSTPAGFTAGPYSGTLNGSSVALFCDDAIDSAPIGGSWSVNQTLISNATSNTRFGEQTINQTSTTYFPAGTTQAQLPTGVVLYQELAWLFTQLGNTTPNSTYALGIQQAAWDLTSTGPSDHTGANSDLADAKIWIAAAGNDYNQTSGVPAVSVDGTTISILNPNYSAWLIVTQASAVNQPGGGGNQEFLALHSAPEPATFGLVGAALLASGLLLRRKHRAV